MAKGPLVTDEIEAFIASIYQKHPKWKGPAIRNEASYILHKNNPKLPVGWPSLSSVQKVLATARKKANELPDTPLDKPWRMTALDKYPELEIESPTPEAISAMLGVWKFRREQAVAVAGQWSSDMQEQPFTIREAKWAARLSALFKDDLQKLSDMASRYARLELIYQLIGRPFDSTTADNILLMEKPIFGKRGDEFEAFLPLLANREDAIDQIRDLKEGKGTGITIGKQKKEVKK